MAFEAVKKHLLESGIEKDLVDKFADEMVQAACTAIAFFDAMSKFHPAAFASAVCAIVDMYAREWGVKPEELAQELCGMISEVNEKFGPME